MLTNYVAILPCTRAEEGWLILAWIGRSLVFPLGEILPRMPSNVCLEIGEDTFSEFARNIDSIRSGFVNKQIIKFDAKDLRDIFILVTVFFELFVGTFHENIKSLFSDYRNQKVIS